MVYLCLLVWTVEWWTLLKIYPKRNWRSSDFSFMLLVELETARILNILQIISEYVYVHGGRWGRGHLHLQNILKLLSNFYLIWKHIYKWIVCIQMFRDLKLHKMMDIYIQTPPWLLCFVGKQYRLISTSNFVTFSKFKESV